MSASTEFLQARLDTLASGRVWPAAEADAVAGVLPRVVVEPTGDEEVAAVLAFADQEGLKVLPRGGGTQLGIGFPPAGGDILLSLTRLSRVIEHTPHDLTVTVQAGLRLADLQATLSASHQWLALDPMLPPAATIGGIVATNASGPRRLRYGGVRDQIIGTRVVLADGTIAKGGGKVVKNVAGYDLPKLYANSLGTLGVIVAASFRLYPIPEFSRTVMVTAPNPDPLCVLAVRVIGSTLVPTALDIAGPVLLGAECALLARFESGLEAVEDQAARLCAMAGPLGTASRTLHDDEEQHVWRQIADGVADPLDGEAALLLKASLLPTEVALWLATLRDIAHAHALTARWVAHAGHGLIVGRVSGASAALVAALDPLRQAAINGCGNLVILDAPPKLARQVDVWGPSSAFEIMRHLKVRFDPRSTLNPGRFVGGI